MLKSISELISDDYTGTRQDAVLDSIGNLTFSGCLTVREMEAAKQGELDSLSLIYNITSYNTIAGEVLVVEIDNSTSLVCSTKYNKYFIVKGKVKSIQTDRVSKLKMVVVNTSRHKVILNRRFSECITYGEAFKRNINIITFGSVMVPIALILVLLAIGGKLFGYI